MGICKKCKHEQGRCKCEAVARVTKDAKFDVKFGVDKSKGAKKIGQTAAEDPAPSERSPSDIDMLVDLGLEIDASDVPSFPDTVSVPPQIEQLPDPPPTNPTGVDTEANATRADGRMSTLEHAQLDTVVNASMSPVFAPTPSSQSSGAGPADLMLMMQTAMSQTLVSFDWSKSSVKPLIQETVDESISKLDTKLQEQLKVLRSDLTVAQKVANDAAREALDAKAKVLTMSNGSSVGASGSSLGSTVASYADAAKRIRVDNKRPAPPDSHESGNLKEIQGGRYLQVGSFVRVAIGGLSKEYLSDVVKQTFTDLLVSAHRWNASLSDTDRTAAFPKLFADRKPTASDLEDILMMDNNATIGAFSPRIIVRGKRCNHAFVLAKPPHSTDLSRIWKLVNVIQGYIRHCKALNPQHANAKIWCSPEKSRQTRICAKHLGKSHRVLSSKLADKLAARADLLSLDHGRGKVFFEDDCVVTASRKDGQISLVFEVLGPLCGDDEPGRLLYAEIAAELALIEES